MRNIVVFIDGTGQDCSKQETVAFTNVARLHEGCKNAQDQSVKYCNGVGTDSYETFTGNAFGRGLESRIIEAYIFLQQEVGIAKRKKEDFRIYLFGFSRGAFAVRWLAAVIKFSGIPMFGVSERKGLYNFWNNDANAADKLKKSEEYYDVPVEMIGVWDTVQATTTSDFGIRDLPDNVECAYHAMALDEYRAKFEVTRFNPSAKVKEVWFAGCHADVGGGYADGLVTANITLSWMIDMARLRGLSVDKSKIPNFENMDDDTVTPIIHDEMEFDKDMGLAQKCIAAIWHIGNRLRHEKKHVRSVEATDTIHDSVRCLQNEYQIGHLQDTSECTIWDNADRTYFA